MDARPFKRRRLSPERSRAVHSDNAGQHGQIDVSKNGGTGRDSFLSPMKASPARFSPKLPAQKPRTGNFPLRKSLDRRNPSPPRTSTGNRYSTSAAVRNNAPTTNGLTPLSFEHERTQFESAVRASPPRDEQEECIGAAAQPSPVNGDSSTQLTRARAIPARSGASTSPDQDDDEPEFPPTPTQLGIDSVPEIPKGLISSSPSRRTVRRACPPKSSPLKPKDQPKMQLKPVDDTQEDSDTREPGTGEVHGKERNAETIAKRQKIAALQDQLQSLNVNLWSPRSLTITQKPGTAVSANIAPQLITSNSLHETSTTRPPLSSRLQAFLPLYRPARPPDLSATKPPSRRSRAESRT